MDTIAVFILFFAALLFSLYHDISILYALLLGLLGFTVIARTRGYRLRSLGGMMLKSSQTALIVIKIFVLIGAITAVWRACGTIAYIVYYGISMMQAEYFILFTFLLCCLVSFLLGTSFGTVGTIGVVLIVMAKSGNVNINIAAGAIIAGAYFGDRCSPMSSSANLVATLTHTKLYQNIANMIKTSVIPFIISLLCCLYVSLSHPLSFYDQQIQTDILNLFVLDNIVLLPAAIILLLAAFRVDVKLSMGVSIVSGILIGFFVQHIPFSHMLTYIALGYHTEHTGFFASIIQGGGLYSMLNVSLIVLLSSAYAGIFSGTGLLKDIEDFLQKLSEKITVYPTTILASLATAAFSCNQTLAVMLTHQFQHKIYERNALSPAQLALDMENTVILLSAVIPWNIAVAVPLAALSADSGAILYAFYLFLVPLANLFTRKILSAPTSTASRLS